MILRIDTAAKTHELHDADDTSGFHCEVVGEVDPLGIDESVAGLGRVVGEDLWITVSSLRAMAEGQGVSDDFAVRFQQLLDEAGRRGQLNDDRNYIMADVHSA